MPLSCVEIQCGEVFRRHRTKRKRVPVIVRLTAYLSAIFRKGTRVYTVDFVTLARAFTCTKRTVESAVAALRKDERFIFKTVRIGRSYAVQVSDRNASIKGVFSLPRKKEIQNNTGSCPVLSKNSPRWISKPPPRKILALAGFVARNVLGKLHRAESRTMFRFAHAYRFATDALHAGFGRDEIAEAYRYALRSVDDELAHLPRETRWEPSSLVRLARRRLRDGLDAGQRVRHRAALLRNAGRDRAPALAVTVTHRPTVPTDQENAAFRNSLAALMAQYRPAAA